MGGIKVLCTNIVAIIVKFLYEFILTRFGCPLTIVIDQDVHFINDVVNHSTYHFILKHVIFTTYYSQGNGQEIRSLVLLNDNKTYWDEHLVTLLFSYRIAYKVATRHTPYQLIYGLHLLMPTKYVFASHQWRPQGCKSNECLTSKIFDPKKLQNGKLQAIESTRTQ